MTPTNIIEQLQRDEGYKQFPYRDSRGVETIGYGFNLRDTGLSIEECSTVLAIRVSRLRQNLWDALPWTQNLDPVRFSALVNMVYNMGLANLLKFDTFLNLVKAHNYDAASQDEVHTLWAEQVGDRAKRLAEQMRTGEWQ